MTTHPSTTSVPAPITLSREQTAEWTVTCHNCKQPRAAGSSIRTLFVGGLGLELCAGCVDELSAAVAASSTATRAKHELDPDERDTLQDIFAIARSHSRSLREKERALYAAVAAGEHLWTDTLNTFEAASDDLAAALAPAAILRLAILAPLQTSTHGLILALEGDALRRWLLPLFEDAGIADDFTVTQRWQEELGRE